MNLTARIYSIITGALLAIGTNQVYATMPESEPNHPIEDAQVLPGTASQIEISGAISLSDDADDVDFFSFTAQEGDVLIVDVDYGFASGDSVDTVIAIFGPDHRLLRTNDDSPVDPGSAHQFDARIDQFLVPASGTYTVGVSSYPRSFSDGGRTSSGPVDEGDYVLVIDGISVSSLQITMEIKPSSRRMSPPVNPRSKGKIPVALMGSKDFDVRDVDKESLTFGSSGDEKSLYKCAKRTRDINRDGYRDLLCHFYTAKANFNRRDLEGHLKGHMKGQTAKESMPFEGSAWLKIVPDKTKD